MGATDFALFHVYLRLSSCGLKELNSLRVKEYACLCGTVVQNYCFVGKNTPEALREEFYPVVTS